MDLKQKVRTMRKYVRRLQEERDFAYEDMSMFGAPTECYKTIEVQIENKAKRNFNKLGLTEKVYDTQLAEYSHLEGKFCRYGCPPQAYYDMLL